MKNTSSDMRSILSGINKRNKEEDQMPYLEDKKANQNTQSEWQEKRFQDYKNNLKLLFKEAIKAPNICLIGVTEENPFEEIMMENFPNLVKEIDIKPQEAQRIPKLRDPKRPTHHN